MIFSLFKRETKMEWREFYNSLQSYPHYYTLNPRSGGSSINSKKIILFGNCHMATIGFFLHYLLGEEYRIHIIITWYFESQHYEESYLQKITDNLRQLISDGDIFFYHRHKRDLEINALELEQMIRNKENSYNLPNFRFTYSDGHEQMMFSLEKIQNMVIKSDFPEYDFVANTVGFIRFFNIPDHPTHFLLFLLSNSCALKVMGEIQSVITYASYFEEHRRCEFEKAVTCALLRLPGFDDEQYMTMFPTTTEYYDIPYVLVI